jgi:predicted transcriptional regulator
MNGETVYTQLQELSGAFSPLYQPAVQTHGEAVDFAGGWYWLLYLRMRQPEGATLNDIVNFNVYLSEERNRTQLQTLMEKGHVRNGNGQYRLTEKGQQAIEGFFTAAQTSLGQLQLVNPVAMTRLADLLYKVVKRTAAAAFPIPKEAFASSRWSDAGPEQPAAVRVDQYSTDLMHFHDDALEAGWRPQGISGFAWRNFTLLHQNGPQTLAQLTERTANDGIENPSPYLNELCERGWIALDGETYQITETGAAAYNQIITKANKLYLLGWLALPENEQEETLTLMSTVRDDLQRTFKLAVWQKMNGALAAAAPLHQPQTGPAFDEYGLNKPGYFFTLWTALSLEPGAISTAKIRKQFPYTSPAVYDERLANLVQDGMMAATDEPGEYAMTEKGRHALITVDTIFVETLGQIEFLPAEEMNHLTELVTRLSDTSLKAEKPGMKWALQRSHNLHRGRESTTVRLDEGLDDMNAFRDDAHLATFLPLDVSGPAWEALSYLWRGEQNTPAGLAEQLPFRGWGEEGYAAAYNELVAKGWATPGDDGYTITEAGRQVREQSETETNNLFFAPWSALSNDELQELDTLLTRLRERITTLLPAES